MLAANPVVAPRQAGLNFADDTLTGEHYGEQIEELAKYRDVTQPGWRLSASGSEDRRGYCSGRAGSYFVDHPGRHGLSEEKGRIPAGTLGELLRLLDCEEPSLVEVPVTRRIIAALLDISREAVPDMPDRGIAHGAESGCGANQPRWQDSESQIQTIW